MGRPQRQPGRRRRAADPARGPERQRQVDAAAGHGRRDRAVGRPGDRAAADRLRARAVPRRAGLLRPRVPARTWPDPRPVRAGACRPRSTSGWSGSARPSTRRSPLRTLSKGMCQKVAIAQALLARPGPAGTGRGVDRPGPGRARHAGRGRGGAAGRGRRRCCSSITTRRGWPAGSTSAGSWRGGTVTCSCRTAPAERAAARPEPARSQRPAAGARPSLHRAHWPGGRLAAAARPAAGRARGCSPVAAAERRGDRLVRRERSAPAASDAVLRQLLSWDGVHVRAVSTGDQGCEPRTGAGQ